MKNEKSYFLIGGDYMPTKSDIRILTESFFFVVRRGNEADLRSFLAINGIDVLAEFKGQNVMQAFCRSVRLPENRYLAKDFKPELEIKSERLQVYYVLNTYYQEALRQKQEARQALENEHLALDSMVIGTPVRMPLPVQEVAKPQSTKPQVVKKKEAIKSRSLLAALCFIPPKKLRKMMIIFLKMNPGRMARKSSFFKRIFPHFQRNRNLR